MARMLVAAVRDDVSEQYGNLMVFLTPGQAERSFQDAVNNPQGGDMFNHPEHFQLFALGGFDTSTGMLEVYDAPRHLVSGANVKVVADA